ncbi:MAG: hypothetical protein R3A78_08895 [Polyangiales bacterium]|nr:hypothetical protein [Myxococcales bacterium]
MRTVTWKKVLFVVSALLAFAGATGCSLDSKGTGAGAVGTGNDSNRPGTIDGGDTTDDGGDDASVIDHGPSCSVDEDIGSALGDAVASGTTKGQGDEATPQCTYNSFAPDLAYRWTAPSSAIFSIDTIGSAFDTVLHVYGADCEGKAIACNDEVRPKRKVSRVRIELEAGDTVVIVVDGYRRSEGNFILNIMEEPPSSEADACADGFDNDRDGDADCDDYECRTAENCLPPDP